MHDHDDDHNHPHDGTSRARPARSGIAAGGQRRCRLAWAAAPQVDARHGARGRGAWLAPLDARLRRGAQLEWTSRWRESWHYVPRSRPGVALRAMDAGQTSAAWDLLGSLLSARGLDQVRGHSRSSASWASSRQPRLPRPRQLLSGRLRRSLGPCSLGLALRGASPLDLRAGRSRSRRGRHADLLRRQPCARAPRPRARGLPADRRGGNAAFTLIGSLEGGLRSQAVIADARSATSSRAGGRFDKLTRGPLARLERGPSAAVSYASSSSTPAPCATRSRRPALTKVREAGIEALHFAWAGSLARGPTALFPRARADGAIEYDTPGRRRPCALRYEIDPHDVFGRDLLKTHYRGAHRANVT